MSAAAKENASAVNVELPKDTAKAKVSIPVAESGNTVVLMKVEDDGSLTPVPTSAVSADGKGLCANIEQGSYVIVDNRVEFKDIQPGAWYESGASFAAARNLMVGVGENNFGGSGTLTTAQTAAVIDRLGGAAVADSWNKAAEKYGTEEINTRENTMSMLFEAYKAMGGKPVAAAAGVLDDFTDTSSVSANNLEAMQWAVQIGLMKGIGDGLVDPLGELTRAQFGTILERFVNLLTNGAI